MTPQAFLDLSTKLVKDMKEWIPEAHKGGAMSDPIWRCSMAP